MWTICKFILSVFLFCFFIININANPLAGNSDVRFEKSYQPFQFNINVVRELIQFYSQQGNQRTGSTADKNTLTWMEKILKNEGYKVTFQSFPFLQTFQSKATLTFKTLDYRTLEGMTLFNSEGTDSNGLTAQFGEPDEAGYIPVFHYFVMLPHENLSSEFIQKNHQKLDKLLASNQYPAVVVVTQGNKRGLAPFNINLHNSYHIPIVLISSSFGNLLEMEAKINKRVRIIAKNKRKESTGYNLIASLKGQNPKAKPLIIMVSRNTWWRGSAERGTGIAAWLAVAKKLSLIHPKRSVIMVALGGSELGHLGYRQFLHEYHSLIKTAYAWIYIGANIAGQPPSSLYIKTNDRKLYQLTRNVLIMHHFTDVILAKKSFHDSKTPAISFIGRSNECYHLRCDKWPTTVSIDNEMLFIKTLGGIAKRLIQ